MTKTNNTLLPGFLRSDMAGGILLIIAAVLALIFANTPLDRYYQLLLSTPVEVRAGDFSIDKPLLLWINDGLMAIFFFLVGLELKRELLEGELSEKGSIVLPGVGAVGGMLVPALIYVGFNFDDPRAVQGWAIPAATDIAFVLGVLKLLGPRVPRSIKIFLTSLAIFDDIGAIIIIALFYTANLSLAALIVVMCCLPALFWLNRSNITTSIPYVLIGSIMWAATLKSGVHATLAGVVMAMFIPLKIKTDNGKSPLEILEHDLQDMVSLFVLPVFAFANAGINFKGLSMQQVFHDVPVGIALGLFLGKLIGVFLFCWVFIRLKLAVLPAASSWTTLLGASALCGIGFTMSLFIGSLAFEQTGVDYSFDERLGIIIGSLLSGIVGYLILRYSLRRQSITS